jgi:hypothetical protein
MTVIDPKPDHTKPSGYYLCRTHSAIRSVYIIAEYEPQRREVLQWWADYVQELLSESKTRKKAIFGVQKREQKSQIGTPAGLQNKESIQTRMDTAQSIHSDLLHRKITPLSQSVVLPDPDCWIVQISKASSAEPRHLP